MLRYAKHFILWTYYQRLHYLKFAAAMFSDIFSSPESVMALAIDLMPNLTRGRSDNVRNRCLRSFFKY